MSFKVEAFQMEGWKEVITGLVLSENDDWVLVGHIPSDYVVDGYRIISKQYIVQRIRKSAEIRAERVFKLRDKQYSIPSDFSWGDAEHLLNWVEGRYHLFQFQDREEDDVMVGRIDVIEDGFMQIIFVDVDGNEDEEYDMEFPLSEITVIEFGTVYMDSVALLWKDNGY